jgi:hypothetical protein
MEGTSGQGSTSSGSFWTGPFLIGIGLLVGVGLGIAFYILGGLPRDHDRYGEVSVPGQAVLALPGEEVRLDFENHASRSGDTTSIDDQPPGMKIRIVPAAGGEEVEVSGVPSWIFSSTHDDRGHEPEAKADIPSAGDYLVSVSDDSSGALPPPPQGAGAPAEPPQVDTGAAISVGQKLWTPLGSRLAGAMVVCLAVFLVMLLFSLPFRLIRR